MALFLLFALDERLNPRFHLNDMSFEFPDAGFDFVDLGPEDVELIVHLCAQELDPFHGIHEVRMLVRDNISRPFPDLFVIAKLL